MKRYGLPPQERSFLEGLPQPFAVFENVDGKAETLAVSAGFCAMLGLKDHAQAYREMEENLFRYVYPEDSAGVIDAFSQFLRDGGSFDKIFRLRGGVSAGYRVIHASGSQKTGENGARYAFVWYMDEGVYSLENAQKNAGINQSLSNAIREENIVKSGRYDYLTGLPGMSYFFELADQKRREIGGESAALLYMDLNGMRFFNSKNSFSAGDALLCAFAELLMNTFQDGYACHVSGDHFMVFTAEERLEDRILRFFENCKEINGGNSLPVRVGVYFIREDDSISTACDRAKFACDTVRKTYQSDYRYYSADLEGEAERRQYILSNLDRAIADKWIQVYFQPIVRTVNGKICGEEALARWIDPVKGLLSPGEFISILEEAGVIYKLDLYVVEQVLDKIRVQREHGMSVVPHSVNLSRSDFDVCDIVEEIRRRVDEAGISRDMITVEITEGMIGTDFDFMKEQITRFRELGFPVWMDDFGSGYSSLDVLQSIQFDLLKFDMSFMRKLDDGDNGKIILTELMKMANALGVDTVCEGVETEAQVRFLREVGCSMLQGYYYCKAIPLDMILDRNDGLQITYENPEEARYYEEMGRINLYDIAVIANEENSAFHHFFNTLPMGVIEVSGDSTRFVRSNQSYREFIKRFFGLNLSYEGSAFAKFSDSFMKNVVKTCCELGTRSFYDEKMPDGSVVHSFARRIGVNPVNGNIAVAVVVLSITDSNEGATYAEIARALASDYYNIYYVDMDTGKFIEYSSPVGGEELAMERHGENFFAQVIRDTNIRIYEEDRERFLAGFTKENIIRELNEQGVFTTTYRLIDSGEPLYASMKINRMESGSNRIIMGISIVDSQMKQNAERDRLLMEEEAYARILAMSGDYLTLYTVDPDTGHYFEFSATNKYEALGFEKEGDDFFRKGRIDGEKTVYHEDLPEYLARFTRESVLHEIREKGAFRMRYRLVIDGEPTPVVLKIVPVRERDGNKLIVGVREWIARH